MPSTNLPETVDVDYADNATYPGRKAHQQHHDTLHAVTNALTASAMTTAARDALTGTDLWPGRVIYNTTTGRLDVYDGAAWGRAVPAPHPFLTMGA